MSNEAERVAHRARGEAECCMVPQDPTLSALLLIHTHLQSTNSCYYYDKGNSAHTTRLVPSIHPRKIQYVQFMT